MADGIEADTSRPKLEYPYPEPPPRGQSLEVAPGVRWIRMPLPYALKHDIRELVLGMIRNALNGTTPLHPDPLMGLGVLQIGLNVGTHVGRKSEKVGAKGQSGFAVEWTFDDFGRIAFTPDLNFKTTADSSQ